MNRLNGGRGAWREQSCAFTEAGVSVDQHDTGRRAPFATDRPWVCTCSHTGTGRDVLSEQKFFLLSGAQSYRSLFLFTSAESTKCVFLSCKWVGFGHKQHLLLADTHLSWNYSFFNIKKSLNLGGCHDKSTEAGRTDRTQRQKRGDMAAQRKGSLYKSNTFRSKWRI